MGKTYIIAEVGVNHNGSLEVAKELALAAAQAGCDAVKFQTFRAQELVTKEAPRARYQERNCPGGSSQSQLQMLKALELSDDAFFCLSQYCEELGIEFLSTPFDMPSVELLESIGVKRYKIGSGNLTDKPLLEAVAATGKPVILSCGMSTLEEVAEAISWLEKEGCPSISLLHCTSNYPTDYADVNMRAMATLKDSFGVRVGYSDHTIGFEIPLMAVALGAEIVEKHITLDPSMDGPDHLVSLPAGELAGMVSAIRHIEKAFGSPDVRRLPCEEDAAAVARKSIVTARPICKGTVIQMDDLACRRPGTGIAPKHLGDLVGLRAAADMAEGHMISWEEVRR